MIPAPPPGLYPGIAAHQYHQWDAASASQLRHLDRSPAHLRAYLHGLLADETPDKNFGTWLHTAVLEPELFVHEIVRGPEGDGRTKKVKDAKAVLEMKYPDAEIVSAKEYDKVIAMRDRILSCPDAKPYLSYAGPGSTELSVVWHQETLLCKGRLDLPLPEQGRIVDIKTTKDARRSEFERSIANYGYAAQAAHYLDGANAQYDEHFDVFTAIVAEKEPPYEVVVYHLDAEALRYGRMQIEQLRQRYLRCIMTDHWPGYEGGMVGLPSWKKQQLEYEYGDINGVAA